VISIHETTSGATLTIRVQPRARKNAILGELGGTLKIAVTAPPVDGRANEVCAEFLGQLLHLPHSCIAIISGQHSRNKVVRIQGMAAEEIRKRLGA